MQTSSSPIVAVEISEICALSYPCQHAASWIHADGTKSKAPINGKQIAEECRRLGIAVPEHLKVYLT